MLESVRSFLYVVITVSTISFTLVYNFVKLDRKVETLEAEIKVLEEEVYKLKRELKKLKDGEPRKE